MMDQAGCPTLERRPARAADALRPVAFERGVMCHAEGSALVSFGRTRVLCSASLEDRVPAFRKGSGGGWLTAEYGMLPRSTHTRMDREAAKGKQSGRTQEIQRLIGRSLRHVVDLQALGERTLTIDCDVLQADGGTRTAAITGAWLAVHDALLAAGLSHALRDGLAAVSVGMVNGCALLDLDYLEDSKCDTDLNVVMTAQGHLVEVQGTAEGIGLGRAQFDQLLDLAAQGIAQLCAFQKAALLQPLSGAPGQVLAAPTERAVRSVGLTGGQANGRPTEQSIEPVTGRTAARPSTTWVLASGNAGKLRELHALLSPLGVSVKPQSEWAVPEAAEPHGTFVENALAKARHASRCTGLPALADDSGLVVLALNGAPGVRSARYAEDLGRGQGDAANLQCLLEAMQGREDRRACYVAALVWVAHADDPMPVIAQGVWWGEVAQQLAGQGGFGYDPGFWLPDQGCTVAQLDASTKNRLSHRAQAVQQILAALKASGQL